MIKLINGVPCKRIRSRSQIEYPQLLKRNQQMAAYRRFYSKFYINKSEVGAYYRHRGFFKVIPHKHKFMLISKTVYGKNRFTKFFKSYNDAVQYKSEREMADFLAFYIIQPPFDIYHFPDSLQFSVNNAWSGGCDIQEVKQYIAQLKKFEKSIKRGSLL